jgi:hypothetical protein
MAEVPLSTQRYRFVAGSGNEYHLKEINAMADCGYRATHMIFDGSGEAANKEVLVLMELKEE